MRCKNNCCGLPMGNTFLKNQLRMSEQIEESRDWAAGTGKSHRLRGREIPPRIGLRSQAVCDVGLEHSREKSRRGIEPEVR